MAGGGKRVCDGRRRVEEVEGILSFLSFLPSPPLTPGAFPFSTPRIPPTHCAQRPTMHHELGAGFAKGLRARMGGGAPAQI
jgi:hypothetical protein